MSARFPLSPFLRHGEREKRGCSSRSGSLCCPCYGFGGKTANKLHRHLRWFAGAIQEESDDPAGPAAIQQPLRLDQMSPNLVANRAEDAVRKFKGIAGRIEFTGLLADPDDAEHELEI